MPVFHILISGFIAALAVTSIGFKKTVWFISIGYTLSITVFCLLSLVFHHADFHILNYFQVILLLAWGCRLGFFIIRRESNSTYNSSVKDQTEPSQKLPVTIKTGIWLSVSLLYVCMYAPAVFSLQVSRVSPLFSGFTAVTGLLIMGCGLVIEAVADEQKSRFKELNPKGFCNTGLYKWVRCPNYLGEIMVWTGSFICAVSYFNSWWQWIIAVTGLLCIVLIMMGSAKRLEKKHITNYGKDPSFQKYEKSVPILFPWIRLYSLQNIKVYLE
jgi:steroid 5-alpha reductase family enzyme